MEIKVRITKDMLPKVTSNSIHVLMYNSSTPEKWEEFHDAETKKVKILVELTPPEKRNRERGEDIKIPEAVLVYLLTSVRNLTRRYDEVEIKEVYEQS